MKKTRQVKNTVFYRRYWTAKRPTMGLRKSKHINLTQKFKINTI